MEHCLTVTSCCRPCIWWYTISKMSLKNCKGETINVLSYLWLPQLKRQVWNLLSPCVSNQEIRTLLFLRWLLLWRVQCTGGKLSLKNYPGWRMSQVDQRCSFFESLPPSLPHFCSSSESPALLHSPLLFLLQKKVPSEAKDRPTQNSVDILSLRWMATWQSEWILAPTEQNALGPFSADLIPPSIPSQGLWKNLP